MTKIVNEPNEQVFPVLPNFYFAAKYVGNPIIEGVEYKPLTSDKGSTLRYGIYTVNTEESITFYANGEGGAGTPQVVTPTGVVIVNYHWEFGDGSEGFGPVVSHTYPMVLPTAEVKLTVTDSRNRVYSVAKRIDLVTIFPLKRPPFIAKLGLNGQLVKKFNLSKPFTAKAGLTGSVIPERYQTYHGLELKYATYKLIEEAGIYKTIEDE